MELRAMFTVDCLRWPGAWPTAMVVRSLAVANRAQVTVTIGTAPLQWQSAHADRQGRDGDDESDQHQHQ